MTAPAAGRTGYGKLTALANARPDRGTRRARYAALNGTDDTERTTNEKTAALRAPPPDDTEAHPGATGVRGGTCQIQRAATGPDRASLARDLHWATSSAALLTAGEPGELTSATPAPGK